MKKAAILIAVITLTIFIITWGVMGIRIFSGNYDIELLVYVGLSCLIGFFASIVTLRLGSWKCPHCGKVRWINGRYCSNCGKEI